MTTKVMTETSTSDQEFAPIQAYLQTAENEVAKPLTGQVVLAKIHSSVRMRKAIKSFFIFFGLAIASIFVPILHFFLVPGFLILSIFMAINAYSDSQEIANLDLKCAKCGTSVTLAEKRQEQYPFWVKCPSCQTEYRIEKSS